MKVAVRLLVPMAALSLVVLSSCRSGSPGESPTTISTTSVQPSTTTTADVDAEPPPIAPGFGGIDLGVLADFELRIVSPPDYVPAPPGEGSTFQLLDCRTVWPGLYVLDFDWTPAEGVELPLQAYLGWAFTSSDFISITTYHIVLDTGGRFSVPIDGRLDAFPPTDGVWGGRRVAFAESIPCYADVKGEGISGGSPFARLRVEPVDLSGIGPAGTLQELVGGIVPGDVSDPLLPIADLYARSTNLPIDRIYLERGNPLEQIVVSVDASCVRVGSVYNNGLEVRQSRGCKFTNPSGYDETYPIRFEDEAWLVEVRGVDSHELVGVNIDGAERLGADGKYFDPDTWLDAALRTSDDITEIVRLPFKEWRISVTTGVEDGRPFLRENIVGPGRRVGHGIRGVQAGVNCARWGVHETDAGTFLLVLTSDPTWRIEVLLDQWTLIDIADEFGFGVGLLALDGPISTPDLRGIRSDQSPVTCLAGL